MTSSAFQVGKLLQASDGQLVTAESCTGGLIADSITKIPGASAWYIGGWVTYSNAMKCSQLGIDSELFESHGAVSWQVAKAMCEGAIQNSDATSSLSTTGIAGPSGGTEDKPVGTVFIGCTVENMLQVREFRFSGSRNEIRSSTVAAAFEMICQQLSGEDEDVMCCQYGATHS